MSMKLTSLLAISIAVLIISGCDSENGNTLPINPDNESLVDLINGLPDDPGEAGKLTIEGVDIDNDGIRDDLQRYIVLEYQTRPELLDSLRMYAIANQNALLEASDKAASMNNALLLGQAVDCVYQANSDYMAVTDILSSLDAEVMNTFSRIEANLEFDSQLAFEVFRGKDMQCP